MADLLSRIEKIEAQSSKIETLEQQNLILPEEIYVSQQTDPELQAELNKPEATTLFNQVPIFGTNKSLWCRSGNIPRPFIPEILRTQIIRQLQNGQKQYQ